MNRRLADVAVSRGRYGAQIYTNDKTQLAEALSREVSHRFAMEPSCESVSIAHEIEPASARGQAQEHTQVKGRCISRKPPIPSPLTAVEGHDRCAAPYGRPSLYLSQRPAHSAPARGELANAKL